MKYVIVGTQSRIIKIGVPTKNNDGMGLIKVKEWGVGDDGQVTDIVVAGESWLFVQGGEPGVVVYSFDGQLV